MTHEESRNNEDLAQPVTRSWKRRLLGAALFLAGMVAGMLLLIDDGQEQKATEAPVARKTYAAVAKGRVDIEGGLIKLAAARDGVLRDVLVEEGAAVTKGQVLAALTDDAQKLEAAVAREEMAQAQADMAGIEVRLKAAERDAKRYGNLLSSSAVSRMEYDKSQDQAAQLRAELASARARLQTARGRLERAVYELERSQIRAPLDGVIVKRMARPGDGVSSLNVTPLFLFAPEAPRIVRAELEERFVQAVKAGMRAEIIPEVDENRRYAGTVLRVGSAFTQREGTDDASQRKDVRMVDCVLTLEDADLIIGQRVLVKFLPEGAPAPTPGG